MDQKIADKISKKVQNDYNRIAKEFSNKRLLLTPDILDFAKYINKNDLVLDVGCGNGRLCELVEKNEAEYIGIDNSLEMIKESKNLYPDKNFIFSDKIDFPKNTFDKIFCLAVIHHIPSEEKRIEFLKQIKHTLKPNGILIMTAWNLIPEIDSYKKVEDGDENDILYDFKNGIGETLAQRYIHVFTEIELKGIVEKSGLKISDIYINSRGKKKINQNFVIICKKLS